MSEKKRVLMLASVASMIDQFNMTNIHLMYGMGYEVHVACNFKHGNTCDGKRLRSLKKKLHEMHVICHQWDCPRSDFSAKKCLKAYKQLQDLTDHYHFRWIHCHSPIGGVLARLTAYKRKIKVIYTAHGFHFYQGAPLKNWMLYYPVEKLLACWTDVLITINKEDYFFATKNMKAKKIFYIPGIGIDVDRFLNIKPKMEYATFRQKYQIPENAKILLSVGELNEGKNHRAVIAAMAELSYSNVYYVICGKGKLKNSLKRYAQEKHVYSHIRMLGYQEDMPQIYANADIFVFPSVREGMPVALMEAMAAGLPCVVSDIRGNRELIDNAIWNGLYFFAQGGIRFSLRQPGQLLDAICTLLEDDNLRRKCGLYNQAKVRFYSQTVVQKRMHAIYYHIDQCADYKKQ